MDYNLNWKTHIDTLYQKLNKQSYAIHILAKSANTFAVLTAYHGYVGSLIKYCIIFYGNSTNKDNGIQGAKAVYSGYVEWADRCRPSFIELKLLTLSCVYII